MKLLPVILAGGEGRRLAPLSTPECPKPFLPLPDGQSLLEKTIRRLHSDVFDAPILVGNYQHRYALMNHARAAAISPRAILLEQGAYNTAFAIACAVHYVNRYAPASMLAFLPADHVVEDSKAWVEAMRRAAGLAHHHQTVSLVGMDGLPFSSELGYMQLRGDEVVSFVEKPESESIFDSSSPFYANSGVFIGTSSHFSSLLAEFCPGICAISQKSIDSAQRQWEYEVIAAPEKPFQPLSFDRAVLEKAVPLYAAHTVCGWRDLGTLKNWLAYSQLSIQNQSNRPIRTDRPWGYFETLESGEERTVKRLYVYPGCRLSRQRHFHRSEEWTVESGIAYIEKNHEKMHLGLYESVKISPASWHRLVNPGPEMLIIKEIQYGISDETDIERADDDYGRI